VPRASKVAETRQLVLIHLSDIHFGKHHRFSAPEAVGSGKVPNIGRGSLLESLRRDLGEKPDPNCPVIICITGDLAETGSASEFREAENFIKQLSTEMILGKARGLENIFVVPGNHDLAFGAKEAEDRWTPWAKFISDTFGKVFAARDPGSRISFHDRTSDLGAIIACLNSSEYVEKDTPEATRGLMDEYQLQLLKQFLKNIDPPRLESAIRIALIHHHPILIPGLAEAGHGYDAVENAGLLLNELRHFGFHLVLHGHKHTPYHFSEDSFTAFHEEARPPILIVAGGSTSSKQLQEGGFNCYNQIKIKWNVDARQVRIMLLTSGLKISEKGAPLLSSEWSWERRLIDDRQYLGGPRAPQAYSAISREFIPERDQKDEQARSDRYNDFRFNLPVCEVMPSLVAGQHNEVRLWVEHHDTHWKQKVDRPVEVIWSAGKLHNVVAVQVDEDARFCATMHYYGPMLVQAKLRFADGHVAYGYVYARMPTSYHRPDGEAIDLG
jgi:3',5'-cyclic AMP phosphodiesterase CpdA